MNNFKLENTQNLQTEKDLFNEPFFLDSGHWASHPLFISRERFWLKYDVQKIRFYGALYRYIAGKTYKNSADVLFAPVGDGQDFKYLEGIYKRVYGIDISPVQLLKCPKVIITKEADILNSGYEDGSFDIIIVSQFLHHLHEVGFEIFLQEFYRILRRKGVIAILEPSSLYPPSWLVAFISRFTGKIPAKVEGERPVFPCDIEEIIKKTGFRNKKVYGITYSHVVFPFLLQSAISIIDWPLRYIWPFKLFAESVGYFAEKI